MYNEIIVVGGTTYESGNVCIGNNKSNSIK